MKKRIAFFLGSMGAGGAERVISILSREFAKKDWDTDICVLLDNKISYDIHQSTRVINMVGSYGSRVKCIPYWLSNIRFYAKNEKPDVIISFAARINILVMLACFGLKVHVLVSERNDPEYDGRGLITRILTSLLYPHANKVVFQTKRCFLSLLYIR